MPFVLLAGARYLCAMKQLCVVLGFVSLGLGLAGIALPLLPTTPFLLLSAWLFLKGSPRLHAWLLSRPRLGGYIKDFQERRAIPLRAKVAAVVMMSLSMAVCVVFVAEALWLRLLLSLAAVLIAWHILSYETLK